MSQRIAVADLASPISDLERGCHESIALKRRVGDRRLTESEAAALLRAKNILKTWVQINFARQGEEEEGDREKESLETRKFLFVLAEWIQVEADLKFFGLAE